MGYEEVLKELLPAVFQEIRENIFNEPEILHFIESKQQLEELLDLQKKLLTGYLESFPEGSRLNMEQLKGRIQKNKTGDICGVQTQHGAVKRVLR
ncbi:hypothetical protein [Persephonella sp.]